MLRCPGRKPSYVRFRTVQVASLPIRHHPTNCPLVPTLWPELPGQRRTSINCIETLPTNDLCVYAIAVQASNTAKAIWSPRNSHKASESNTNNSRAIALLAKPVKSTTFYSRLYQHHNCYPSTSFVTKQVSVCLKKLSSQ